jgi:MFS superfamily sulfate permease-like transporter
LATPPLIELGRLGDGHDYVDIARHSDAVRIPGLAIWRPVEPLFFANAERVLGGVEARLRAAGALHATVLSLEESFDIDSTALDVLIEFDQRLARQGLVVRLARVHDRVRDLLAAGAQALADAGCFRVDDAVSSLKQSG